MSAWLQRWRWWIWGGYLGLWTVSLLIPVRGGGVWTLDDLEINRRFLVAKTIHFSAYFVMTLLTAALRAPMRQRFFLMFVLMGHATLTELLQHNMEEYVGRSGSLLDVGLDHAGIAVGMLVSWRWWSDG